MTTIRVSKAEAGELTAILRAERAEATSIVLEPGDYAIDLAALLGAVTVVGEAGASRTRIHALPDRPLFKVSRTGTVASLRGLTLIGGHAPGGGAIDATGETIVIVEDCVFRDNQAKQIMGGAILVTAAVQLTVKRCVFESNISEIGGAIAVSGSARATIQGSVFHANRAALGGALFVGELARATVQSCSFFDDVADHQAGGDSLFAGGTKTSKPVVRVMSSLFVARRPIVNNPERSADLTLSHCIVPPSSLEGVKYRDAGGNIAVVAELVERGEGLWSLRPGSRGTGGADAKEIPDGTLDLLGRPLVKDGRADPGALAPPG